MVDDKVGRQARRRQQPAGAVGRLVLGAAQADALQRALHRRAWDKGGAACLGHPVMFAAGLRWPQVKRGWLNLAAAWLGWS